jgi:hypothetical protein
MGKKNLLTLQTASPVLIMIDYTIFYKKRYRHDEDWRTGDRWDLFISAFNSSQRVHDIFDGVQASEKHWWILPDYNYDPKEYPSSGTVFTSKETHESDFIQEYFDHQQLDIANQSICIDITGFMRPHLLFLMKYLWIHKVKRFDVIYTDPIRYEKKHETKFSVEGVSEVRQVAGFEGNHISDTSNDVLIIGAGYDHQLIAHVAEDKAKMRKIQIFGLPSLQADMYQENVLRANLASEAVGVGAWTTANTRFAPANDPFVTASVLQDTIARLRAKKDITNLYLSPLATKPQVLGFALYYLLECQDSAASIIFPFSQKYNRETTKGLSRIWKYTVEFPST